MKKRILILSTALLVVVLLVGASCATDQANKTNSAQNAVNATATTGNWTSSVTPGEIPSTDIVGTLNGKDFKMAYASVTKWDDEYDWTFSNKAPDSACGVIMDNDAVNFSSKDIQVGTFEKKMSDEIDFDSYHAYYHYEQDSGTPMSVNNDWQATIVVTDIDAVNKKVKGFASFEFNDDLTNISGAFIADYCEI